MPGGNSKAALSLEFVRGMLSVGWTIYSKKGMMRNEEAMCMIKHSEMRDYYGKAYYFMDIEG